LNEIASNLILSIAGCIFEIRVSLCCLGGTRFTFRSPSTALHSASLHFSTFERE
jgi:hypothetical protein